MAIVINCIYNRKIYDSVVDLLMKLAQFWFFGHVSKSLVAKSTTAMNPNPELQCSLQFSCRSNSIISSHSPEKSIHFLWCNLNWRTQRPLRPLLCSLQISGIEPLSFPFVSLLQDRVFKSNQRIESECLYFLLISLLHLFRAVLFTPLALVVSNAARD